MKLMLFICSYLFFFIPGVAFAVDFGFDGITKTEFESVGEEFATNFMHTSVSPATGVDDVWGVEVGFIVGVTDAPKTEALVQRFDSTQSSFSLPHAGILVVATFPYGITGELSMIPEQDFGDVKFDTKSFALKWDFSKVFFDKALYSLAAKIHTSSTDFTFSQTINNSSSGNVTVDSTISLDVSTIGAHLVGSLDFFLIEPYVGFGMVKATTDLTVTAAGSATVFDDNFSLTDSQKAEVSSTGAHYFVGFQLNLYLLHIAGEFSSALGVSKTTGKFSFYF
jgi:hypothetical protein